MTFLKMNFLFQNPIMEKISKEDQKNSSAMNTKKNRCSTGGWGYWCENTFDDEDGGGFKCEKCHKWFCNKCESSEDDCCRDCHIPDCQTNPHKYNCNASGCHKDHGDVYGENCEKCGNWYCKYHPGHIIATLCLDCHSGNGDTEFVVKKSTKEFDEEIEQIRENSKHMRFYTNSDYPDWGTNEEENERIINTAKKDIERLLEILDKLQ
jgi:hypothetical protein